MQDLVRSISKKAVNEDLEILSKYAEIIHDKNLKESTIKISTTILNAFYWHEINNLKYQCYYYLYDNNCNGILYVCFKLL